MILLASFGLNMYLTVYIYVCVGVCVCGCVYQRSSSHRLIIIKYASSFLPNLIISYRLKTILLLSITASFMVAANSLTQPSSLTQAWDWLFCWMALIGSVVLNLWFLCSSIKI